MTTLLEFYMIVSLLCSGLIWFAIKFAREEAVAVLRLDTDNRLYTTFRILFTAPLMLLAGL